MSKAQQTKKRILEGAIALYNERGFTNVKVRDIAEYLQISPGNITYHFPNNRELMNTIYDHMIASIKAVSVSDQILISQGKGMEAPRHFLVQVSKYRFFYKDIVTIIQMYPQIALKHQKMVNRQIEIIESLLFISVGKGYFRQEEIEGMYKTLAEAITNTLHFWLTRQATKGKEDDDLEGALDHISKLIYPYYTEKGLEVYFPEVAAALQR
ncbi:TetR/AcrR family transcriptional regulator [Sediminicola luteus]|uniref:HTH tetR-type domain-containing protein n=1 Tax=Sediminicola luteus TaxID=319238 RepID=A0A2A4GDH9_9FLAO|nr:TetR/AcrR family transcriptional regulator [Sediminicola luteus]PCE66036.1 hypothetical protein B7P33_01670 [Sediminicola luteus]